MTSVIIAPALIYIIYATLESIPVSQLADATKASTIDLAHIDRKLWLEGPLSLLTTGFLFSSRIAKWGFLIYYGISTKWWYALVVLAISIPVAVIISSIIEKVVGRRIMSTLLLPLLPILLIFLYFSIYLFK